MKKVSKYLILCLKLLLIYNILPECAHAIDTSRRTPTIPTLTKLPPFPKVPMFPSLLSEKEKRELRLEVVDHKLSTYAKKPSTSYRVGKFRLAPFAAFEPRKHHIKTIAPHYDLITLPAIRSNLVPLFRKYNPSIKVFMYFYPGLSPDLHLLDAGNVDKNDTNWILANHPDWFLKDARGNPIKAKSKRSALGAHWADPANEQWQIFFAQKLNKTLELTGNDWDGVLLDEFFGLYRGYSDYAGASQQVNYNNDKDFQSAQLSFLRKVTSMMNIPIIPNVGWQAILETPDFFSKVAETAGGAQSEVFTINGADYKYGYFDKQVVKLILDLAHKAPKDKTIILGGHPANIVGDVEATLHSYFTYLLVAGKDREVYWNYKEGSASFPHYWFKEFDLDIGDPKEEMQVVNRIWKRDFTNAVVVVNPTRSEQQYAFDGTYHDVLGRSLKSPLRLQPHTSLLLVKNKRILPKDISGMP